MKATMVHCFRGNESDMWFHEKSLELKMLYEETIHELDAAYSQDGKYRELLPVYERAVAIYPFDDWQDLAGPVLPGIVLLRGSSEKFIMKHWNCISGNLAGSP